MRNATDWNLSRVLDSQILWDNSRHLRRRFVACCNPLLDRLNLCHHCHYRFVLATHHPEIQNYCRNSYVVCHLKSHIYKDIMFNARLQEGKY